MRMNEAERGRALVRFLSIVVEIASTATTQTRAQEKENRRPWTMNRMNTNTQIEILVAVSSMPMPRVYFHNSSFSMARPSLPTRLTQFVLSCIRYLHQWLQSFIERCTSSTVELDSGRTVRIGTLVAEGGFSLVFQARDVHTHKAYALKRVQCPDEEHFRECQREAGVHRALPQHRNLMPLLGCAFHNEYCYMMFPYCTHSLRAEVNRRTHLLGDNSNYTANKKPWNEVAALHLFLAICRGIHTMHEAKFTHRDIKLENILFEDVHSKQPLIMDFGSVGPLTQAIADRRTVLVSTVFI